MKFIKRFFEPEPYPIYSYPFAMVVLIADGVRLHLLEKLKGSNDKTEA